MDKQNIYDYITTEESSWKTTKIPLSNSKEWNMKEHIERCFNVSNGWFHKGDADDETRPYDDIVTPIIDVAFRTEGFDVKDIVPYVDSIKDSYKSFIIKKFHPQWATKNQLDTFIDEVVETSIIYDLVLIKDTNQRRPEVIKLQDIAFCDQTDVLSAPLCFKQQLTIQDLLDYKGKWNDDKIDEAIVLSRNSKEVSMSNDKEAKSNGNYITVYELHGLLPESWLVEGGSPDKYVNQMHIVCYYLSENGQKNGLTLYKGKDKRLDERFYALKIDQVRSYGRACGRSLVERLFQPQVWNNYTGIRIKEMLDVAAMILAQSASDEVGNNKVQGVKGMTVLKTEDNRPITRLDTNTSGNMAEFANWQDRQKQSARLLGSASEASLGVSPSSGTPFALQDLIVQQGEGTHEYRRGKIATFFADVLYPKLFLKYIVEDISDTEFSEELSLDELQEIAESISENIIDNKIKEKIFDGNVVYKEEKEEMKELFKQDFIAGKTPYYQNGRAFMKALEDDMKNIPIKVKVNVAGKQKYLAQNADRLSKLISNILGNPQAFATIPGLGKAYNQLIESSGMNPIDFSSIIKGTQMSPDVKTKQLNSPVEGEQLQAQL